MPIADNGVTGQIIPYYAHPHVFTVINDNTWYDETVAPRPDLDNLPYSTAVVTGADKGIDNTFVRVNDRDTKVALFGRGDYDKYGQSSIQADNLFNGSTSVWFCRVLPDDATYANVIFLMHYRKGKILDEYNQETGKYRLEVKFSTAYANKPQISEGTRNESDIKYYAEAFDTGKPDPQTGYYTVPLCYVRSTGRGKYGNGYSISITRDAELEHDLDIKSYCWNLIDNANVTQIINKFSGSLYQAQRYGTSVLISDVLDEYQTGYCPIKIYPFEDSFTRVFDFYQNQVVMSNLKYIQNTGGTPTELEELQTAMKINNETFDPIFGLQMNTRNGALIPYYKNYSRPEEGEYVAPALVIPDKKGASRPLNKSDWTAAQVGDKVLMVADPLNGGLRWVYTIVSVDPDSGNIVYDEGRYAEIDEDQFDGIRLQQSLGFAMDGGSDGVFEKVSINGTERAPSKAEMKMLLSKEYVRAWRGEKDRKVLSPYRMDIDFIYDANYNMTNEEALVVDTDLSPIFDTSTILTDEEGMQLSAIYQQTQTVFQFDDVNVKKAMFDLNEYRNRAGNELDANPGAGCLLHLDCGLVGLKNIGINYELKDLINMLAPLNSRQCTVDLGYYQIYDPNTHKKIDVTTTYMMSQEIVPHLLKEGFNKPFVGKYCTLNAISRSSFFTVEGNMIRDSFKPDIDEIDYDVKEALYLHRINYWISSNEGRNVRRGTQSTRQSKASVLLEENNVRVLNELKKGLEEACRGYEYEWNDPTARKGYTDAQKKAYEPWIGDIVEDLDIYFTANEWEQERMIMHCYCTVKFRDIVKRVILEINIERPDYGSEDSE